MQGLLEAILEGRKSTPDGVFESVDSSGDTNTSPGPQKARPDRPPRIPSASVVEPSYLTTVVKGSLALAKASGSAPDRSSGIALVSGGGRNTPRLVKASFLADVQRLLNRVPQLQATSGRPFLLKGNLKLSFNRKEAMSALVPAGILLVIATFFLLQMMKASPARPTPDAANRPARLSSASIHRESLRTSPAMDTQVFTPPPPETHLRVIDPATASAVQSLSRFEVRGVERQAKYGDDASEFVLGMMFETGRYVPQNCATAATWVRAAAESGNPAAEYNLALRYRDGDGVASDPIESSKWMARSVAHGYRQTELAVEEQ